MKEAESKNMRPVTVQNLDGQNQENGQDMDGFQFPSEVTIMRRQTEQSAVESEATEVMRIDNESSVQDLESVKRVSQVDLDDDVSDQPVQVFDDGDTNRSSEVVRVDQESEAATEESEVIRRSTFKGDDDAGSSALAESGK